MALAETLPKMLLTHLPPNQRNFIFGLLFGLVLLLPPTLGYGFALDNVTVVNTKASNGAVLVSEPVCLST